MQANEVVNTAFIGVKIVANVFFAVYKNCLPCMVDGIVVISAAV